MIMARAGDAWAGRIQSSIAAFADKGCSAVLDISCHFRRGLFVSRSDYARRRALGSRHGCRSSSSQRTGCREAPGWFGCRIRPRVVSWRTNAGVRWLSPVSIGTEIESLVRNLLSRQIFANAVVRSLSAKCNEPSQHRRARVQRA